MIELSGRHKKQRTANEYYVNEVCAAHPHIHCNGATANIQKVRKRQLIVIAYTNSIRNYELKKKKKRFEFQHSDG